MLAHYLLPLLNRRPSDDIPPARIIWASSLEATRIFLDTSDIQALKSNEPYESAKRLTDVIALATRYPSVQRIAEPFFRPDDPQVAQQQTVPPKMYTTHCGIVTSGLFPVPWFLMWAYDLGLLLCRLIGSPWHTLRGYTGAKAAVYITLEEQSALDEAGIDRVKLGSCADRVGNDGIKLTEVEGYGFDGSTFTPEILKNDTAVGVYHKTVGRRYGVSENVSEKDLTEFQELGAECWKQVEALRLEWEAILDKDEQ